MSTGHEGGRDDARDPTDMSDEEASEYLARMEEEDPDLLLISDYLAGDLDDARTRAVERRLADDPAFAERAAPFMAIVQAVKDDVIRDRVRDVADEEASSPHTSESTARERRMWLSGAYTVLFALGIGSLGTYGVMKALSLREYRIPNAKTINTDGRTTPTDEIELDHGVHVTMEPYSFLSFEDQGAVSRFPSAPGQYAMQVDGVLGLRIDLPTNRNVAIVTPEVRLTVEKATFRIRKYEHCATEVTVTDGVVSMGPRRGVETVRLRRGQSMHVDCNGNLSEGDPVNVEGEMPTTIERITPDAEAKR